MSDGLRRAALRRVVDPRIMILLLLAACLVAQRLPSVWLAPWIGLLFCLFLGRELRTERVWGMVRGGAGFTLFWLVMKIGTDLFGGTEVAVAVKGALPFAGRLLALTLTGAAYAGLSSPLGTGRAVAWFIRPVLGKRAWKPALVVALTAWFLPRILRLAGDISSSMRARGVKLSFWRRLVVMGGTALRILRRQADELAVGLASRRLDDDRVWRF